MPIPSTVFLPQPFANNAGGPYKNTIPDTGGVGPAATWNLGFPPITMQEEVSGGKPPLGQDFNGILNALSTHVFAQQAGQLYRYSAAVSTAIGGYPVGTMLESTDGNGIWFNLVAANTADPDANGAGWVAMFNYGYTTMAGLTGGTVTLSRLEARRGVIVLAGTLVANLAVILPVTLQNWLIVNTTTGAFTTTVRTAAGTGVVVPQGGYAAPTGVYGNGANIYPSVAPVNLPIDQGPTALTIAQRTNAGYLLATYFNQDSALENPALGAVFVQNAAADGFLRKISIANFRAQIFASAGLTGTPTAPTAATGTNTTQIATTAYVQDQILGGPSQAWVDVSDFRTPDVLYVNDTSRPIMVNVTLAMSANTLVIGYVNGLQIIFQSSDVNNDADTVSIVVPAGASYNFNVISGALNAYDWYELR